MARRNQVSVIIPSYNSLVTIGRTLDALFAQTELNAVCEIFVVDSSDDGITKKILAQYEKSFDVLKIIHPGIRVMPAIGRNIGAQEAEGDILVFLDSDAYPAEDWMATILDAFSCGYKAGGGSYLLPPFQQKKAIAKAQWYLQFNEFLPTGTIRVKKFFPACNLFCEKELFMRVGGFPEMRASEDVLFGFKVSDIEKMWFIPEARVYHIFREEIKAFQRNQELLGKHIIKYRRQRSKSPMYRGLIPVLLLPAFLLVKCLLISRRIANAGFKYFVDLLRSLPLFLYGLLFWAVGFYKGCLEKEE